MSQKSLMIKQAITLIKCYYSIKIMTPKISSSVCKLILLPMYHSYPYFWTELHPPPNSYVEVLTFHVVIFRDRAIKKVIKLK